MRQKTHERNPPTATSLTATVNKPRGLLLGSPSPGFTGLCPLLQGLGDAQGQPCQSSTSAGQGAETPELTGLGSRQARLFLTRVKGPSA